MTKRKLTQLKKDPVTTLLLLPGLMCDADVWQHQAANLADLAHIIIPDFRGFDSLTAMAESVLEQAPERFAVAGHSMGGRVALEVVRLAAGRIVKLALLETGADPLAPGELEKRQALIELARTGGMEAIADVWLPPMLHPDHRHDKALLNAIRVMILRTGPEEFIKQVRALINRPDATDCLPAIQCPTLLLAGRHDDLYPVQQHEFMLNEIADASLAIIEDAGHMAPMEQPDAVTNAMREWLIG